LRVEVSLRRPLGAAAQARSVLALTMRAESAYSVDARLKALIAGLMVAKPPQLYSKLLPIVALLNVSHFLFYINSNKQFLNNRSFSDIIQNNIIIMSA